MVGLALAESQSGKAIDLKGVCHGESTEDCMVGCKMKMQRWLGTSTICQHCFGNNGNNRGVAAESIIQAK